MKLAPPKLASSIVMLPPWALIISEAMARPRPRPPVFVSRDLSIL